VIRLKRNHHGFTIVELLVVMTVITLLVSLLLPSLKAGREMAKQAVCSGSQRQVAIAINAYTVDNGTKYPWGTWRPGTASVANPVQTYDTLIDTYIGGPGLVASDSGTWANGNPTPLKVLVCPADPRPLKYGGWATRSYCMTAVISGGDYLYVSTTVGTPPPSIKMDQVLDAGGTFLVVESPNDPRTGRGRQGAGAYIMPSQQSGPLMATNGSSIGTNPTMVSANWGAGSFAPYTEHPYGCGTHPGDQFNYTYADGHCKSIFPLYTDPRSPTAGATIAGMRGFTSSSPTGFYWYNTGTGAGAWSLNPND
jgi:prepilin-type N-terminal cleavage/methylation domain-containing protein/prepilin-type processing-associated H-X9-DG protein